jgi:hypothetical protein
MSLNSVIDSFATGTYAVTRGSAGSYVDGRWTPGGTSVVNIDACIQPVSGKELKALPEAFHGETIKKWYSKVEVFTVTEGATGVPADRIAIGSDSYDVIAVEGWQRSLSGGDYFKAFIARVVP